MIAAERLKGTRYGKSPFFTRNEKGDQVFKGVRSRKIAPAAGVIEHVLAKDERLDLLALQFKAAALLWILIINDNSPALAKTSLVDILC